MRGRRAHGAAARCGSGATAGRAPLLHRLRHPGAGRRGVQAAEAEVPGGDDYRPPAPVLRPHRQRRPVRGDAELRQRARAPHHPPQRRARVLRPQRALRPAVRELRPRGREPAEEAGRRPRGATAGRPRRSARPRTPAAPSPSRARPASRAGRAAMRPRTRPPPAPRRAIVAARGGTEPDGAMRLPSGRPKLVKSADSPTSPPTTPRWCNSTSSAKGRSVDLGNSPKPNLRLPMACPIRHAKRRISSRHAGSAGT